MPPYIPPQSFSLALLDILRKTPLLGGDSGEAKSAGALVEAKAAGAPAAAGASGTGGSRVSATPVSKDLPSAEDLFTQARSIVEKIPPGRLQTNLILLIADAEQTEKNLELWYNDAMNRITGWYKRQAQWIALGIGLVIAVGFNADTISVAQGLWNNTTRLNVLQSSAVELLGKGQQSALGEQLNMDDMARMLGQLPLGWGQQPTGESLKQDWWTMVAAWLIAASGWLLTAFAVSLGSSFWFDTLQKCLRAAGPRIPITEGAGDGINKQETPKGS